MVAFDGGLRPPYEVGRIRATLAARPAKLGDPGYVSCRVRCLLALDDLAADQQVQFEVELYPTACLGKR